MKTGCHKQVKIVSAMVLTHVEFDTELFLRIAPFEYNAGRFKCPDKSARAIPIIQWIMGKALPHVKPTVYLDLIHTTFMTIT